ncbi:iron-containing alcohol dehydrogenase [Lacibacterium aquatile]|uniref:Iron-containing alcohol dehydrogenase n=1 Tax=Lacibacterium aquatile TaxID=1168082 RepID=A0ABW5DQ57_9PROT
MAIVSFQAPHLMLVGGGALSEVPSVLKRLEIERPLIVTDGFMVKTGVVPRIVDLLRVAGIQAGIFADTIPDPTVPVVEAGGGGSPGWTPRWAAGHRWWQPHRYRQGDEYPGGGRGGDAEL